MFHAGFAETAGQDVLDWNDMAGIDADMEDEAGSSTTDAFSSSLVRQFEDSDDEDDDEDDDMTMVLDSNPDFILKQAQSRTQGTAAISTEQKHMQPVSGSESSDTLESCTTVPDISIGPADTDERAQYQCNVCAKLSHPSTPRTREIDLGQDHTERSVSHEVQASDLTQGSINASRNLSTLPGPKKMHVVVRDVAYATYRAVLYYVCFELHDG